MICKKRHAGDRGYDRWNFVTTLKERKITPHIAIQGHKSKTGKPRNTAVNARTTRHPGYLISQIVRKRVDKIFGWTKYASGKRQTTFRGLERVREDFKRTIAAYNLIRLPKLLENG